MPKNLKETTKQWRVLERDEMNEDEHLELKDGHAQDEIFEESEE